MKDQKEIKKQFDKWVDEFCRVEKRFPTVAELFNKAKELGLEKF